MLANIEKKSLLKILVSGSCSTIIFLAALTADAAAETIHVALLSTSGTSSESGTLSTVASHKPGSCLFSEQLASDPALKAAFTRELSGIRDGHFEASTDDDLIYDSDIDAGGTSRSFPEPSKSVDKFSNDCLSCHDGVMAKSFNVRVKNNPEGRVMSLEDIIGGHPIGMEYENYAAVNGKEYRGEIRFSNEMVFAEGRVGCLTCHNPLNDSKGHLVMKNDRSELCFACHKK